MSYVAVRCDYPPVLHPILAYNYLNYKTCFFEKIRYNYLQDRLTDEAEMKMKPEHFDALRAAVLPALSRIPTAAQYAARDSCIPRIEKAKDTAMRHRWDAFWVSRFETRILYRAGYNDAHIDTALRKIVLESGK
jgi:hypothetical protein